MIINDPVQLLDLGPEILSLLGMKIPSQMLGDRLRKKKYILLETIVSKPYVHAGETIRALVYNNYKLIHNVSRNSYELYNLRNDPLEKRNIFDEDTELSKEMISMLETIVRNIKRTELKIRLKYLRRNPI